MDRTNILTGVDRSIPQADLPQNGRAVKRVLDLILSRTRDGIRDSFVWTFSLYAWRYRLFDIPSSGTYLSVAMADSSKRQKVVIIGAGPVGSLAALYAAARGDEVEVYELRGGRSYCPPERYFLLLSLLSLWYGVGTVKVAPLQCILLSGMLQYLDVY